VNHSVCFVHVTHAQPTQYTIIIYENIRELQHHRGDFHLAEACQNPDNVLAGGLMRGLQLVNLVGEVFCACQVETIPTSKIQVSSRGCRESPNRASISAGSLSISAWKMMRRWTAGTVTASRAGTMTPVGVRAHAISRGRLPYLPYSRSQGKYVGDCCIYNVHRGAVISSPTRCPPTILKG
jgi:hypothetical protein